MIESMVLETNAFTYNMQTNHTAAILALRRTKPITPSITQ